MRISADWIATPGAQTVTGLLENASHRAYFVGGCVRNTLLGEPISDIDVATSATPDQVIALAKGAGVRAVPTGVEHGTVTLVVDGLPYEVTTFRRDVETDGRRAVVAFSTDVADDARRRDFTMNALYATREGAVIDPLGGLADLQARRVRFIEDPERRIREDYLRILRFFRFHAWYGAPEHGLDAEGLAACAANSSGLETISRERIGAEMIKLLAAPDPSQAVGAMGQSGVLAQILPGASTRALFPLVHLEGGQGDPIRRLAALGGDEVADRLRLSKPRAKALDLIRGEIGATTPLHELAYRHGAALARSVALARAAVLEMPEIAVIDTDLDGAEAQTFPIKASDLPLSGKALGDELKRLEQIWIDSRFAPGKAELLARAKGGMA